MKKKYVVYENTIKGLEEEINNHKNSGYTYETVLCKYEMKHEVDEEQAKKQKRYKWASNIYTDIRTPENLKTKIHDIFSDILLDKNNRDNIEGRVYDRIMNTKISAVIEFENTDGKTKNIERYTTSGIDEEPNREEYIYDKKEMEDELKNIKYELGCLPFSLYTFNNDKSDSNTFVYVDYLEIKVYASQITLMKKAITKTIKEYIKENLTYCLKKGSNIVPDEYLDKGLEGIKEWRTEKMSSNKKNSMEKRIVKELERKRKKYTYEVLCEIFYTIESQNKEYSIPRFMIEGMYNKQKAQKLANNIIKENEDKGRKLTEKEEILSACKEYWNNEIMNVYKAVNEIEVKDINVK